jgi:hypothetical protein
MATIDPSIALGVKPVQIQDPINTLARGQELQLGQAKFQEYQRGLQEQNALRDLIKTGVDLKSPEAKRKMYEISPEMGMKFEKSQAEIGRLGNEAKLKEFEVQREQFANLAFNPSPENVTAHIQDSVLQGKLSPVQAKQLLDQVLPMNVQQRKQFFTEMAITAEKRFTGDITKRGQDITAATTRRGQDLQYDPDLQAKIAGAKKRAETDVTQEVQGQADVKANRKALATAGYDPVTGKDNISKLIQDSTGSFAGAGTDMLGRVVGVSTKGAQAISQLKTFESKLTQDILGGKLGAGISNTDREFIVQAIGEIANSTLPVETRQAAWDAVKERMRVAGMVEAPKAPANNVNVPGVGTQVNTPGSGAAPASKPTLDSIFGTSKK